MTINLEFLKYVDCFGTTFNFYTERCRKLYTPFGGILTLLAGIFGVTLFFYLNKDEFLHNMPESTTSIKKENYRRIKFGEEKIWIPWRIRNFSSKSIDHLGKLYPIIYYYRAKRNNSLNNFDISYEFINYKLCNETSMRNNSYFYNINIQLDQLYCIDMEDIDIGGSWDTNFLDLVTLDIYICKNGIDYNETDKNCTTYEELIKAAGDNDCYEFELFYPLVQYQPMNKDNPIFVSYSNYFYHFSRYSNKIDRIYLQNYILDDDIGFLYKNKRMFSFWGSASLSGDSYSTGNERDLMNEGSTSRLYSFNIYLKSDVIYYNRNYKKISLICAEGMPVINVVFTVFQILAQVIKIASGNKRLTELLFENLVKKKIKIDNKHLKEIKLKQKNQKNNMNTEEKKLNKENNNQNNDKENLVTASITNKTKINDLSFIKLTKNDTLKQINTNIIYPQINIIKAQNYINENDRKSGNKQSNNNLDMNYVGNKNSETKKSSNTRLEDLISIISKSNNLSYNFNDVGNKVFGNSRHQNSQDKDKKSDIFEPENTKTKYVKATLFPYRYYLCSIFIKRIDISKNSIFFSKKFKIVYNFLSQLLDISSYIILSKEFEIMKNILLVDKYREKLESNKKINVNEIGFNANMKECLNTKKLSILGKYNQ